MSLGPNAVHDVDGQCNARLYLADDYGDNLVTLRCQLKPAHSGEHIERFERDGSPVEIRWVKDERR